MRVPRSLLAAVGAAALFLGTTTAATAAPGAQSAAMNPCGFYETGSDAFYHHCTGDGSQIVIKVEINFGPDYERCVGPGNHWLGSASKIDGAHYTGRLC
ncbi:DUF6355 family natural product biosynthesis protein [Streptomyces sp. NPDC021093]|uniref:DUF6355 family natural product biosynthesis protein n=1 Tax=Streptomyces sp. NPDC021093 TaxID=3365112 RepID=UPI0037B703E1